MDEEAVIGEVVVPLVEEGPSEVGLLSWFLWFFYCSGRALTVIFQVVAVDSSSLLVLQILY